MTESVESPLGAIPAQPRHAIEAAMLARKARVDGDEALAVQHAAEMRDWVSRFGAALEDYVFDPIRVPA